MRIYELWQYGNITMVQLKDVKGIFPSVAKGNLIHAKEEMKFKADL
jgi:hypothetical protein